MNGNYDLGIAAFGNAQVAWLTDTIMVQLIDTALYTVDRAVDEFLADIPAEARVGAPATLAGKTNVAGALKAADTTTLALTGPTIEALALYKDTGDEATSRLLSYWDTGTGLPTIAPSGELATIQWPGGVVIQL